MPTYEYLCQACSKAFELSFSIAEADRKKREGIQCPGCGSPEVVQQISQFQVKTSRKS